MDRVIVVVLELEMVPDREEDRVRLQRVRPEEVMVVPEAMVILLLLEGQRIVLLVIFQRWVPEVVAEVRVVEQEEV
jgi:hypothetical protein